MNLKTLLLIVHESKDLAAHCTWI